MPLDRITGLFTRARKFVDTFASGDEITRSDLDAECDDLASGINAALTSGLNILGEWAAVGAFPTTRPDGSKVRARDTWRVTSNGTVGGVTFAVDDYIVVLQAEPGATYSGNWLRLPNLFLPAVVAAFQAAEDAAAEALDSENAASGSAVAAAASAAAALASLNSVLSIADNLPTQRGPWATATAYGLGDLVQTGGSTYICVIAHTSAAAFATDLAALRWQIFAQQGAPGAGTGDLLASQNLNDVQSKPTARINLETIHFVASATPPASPAARMLWRDTSVSPSRLYLRNDGNTAWILFDPVYSGVSGGVSIDIADLNAHATAGNFRSASGATGNPLGGEGFRFQHLPGADANSATQMAVGVTSGRTFLRNRTAGTWGNWTELFNLALGGQLAAGVTAANDADGTFSTGTYTPTPVGGNFKSISNAGAFTLAAPTEAGLYNLVIEVTNASGAGAITFSGFARVTGDIMTLTVGHRFQVFIVKTLNGVTASIVAMQ